MGGWWTHERKKSSLADSETGFVEKAWAVEIIGSTRAQTLYELERGGVYICIVHMCGMCVSVYTADYTADIYMRLNLDPLCI